MKSGSIVGGSRPMTVSGGAVDLSDAELQSLLGGASCW